MEDKYIVLKRILAWIPAVLVMYIIFQFSAENASESTKTSSGLVEMLISFFVRDFDLKSVEQQLEILTMFTIIVRKTAHFAVYAALGFCVAFAMSFYSLKRHLKCWVSLSICILYAVSDEVHQLFSAGRACKLIDIVIDSAGAASGMLFFVAILFCYHKMITKLKQR